MCKHYIQQQPDLENIFLKRYSYLNLVDEKTKVILYNKFSITVKISREETTGEAQV
jgi:hypothetical protein